MIRTIQVYGILRSRFPKARFRFSLEAGLTPDQVKARLVESLFAEESQREQVRRLLEHSALAGDGQLLAAGQTLGEAQSLSFLPPVCGG